MNDHELEDQDHDATACDGCARIQNEQTYLHMLVFLAVAWLLLGGTGAGLTIAFTGSPWSLLWLVPCFAFVLAGLRQGSHVEKAIKAHG